MPLGRLRKIKSLAIAVDSVVFELQKKSLLFALPQLLNFMIFSCTGKVLDKIKKHRPILSEKAEVGFYNWYIDLMNLERKNYFLFTHSQTMFSFFIYAGTKTEILNLENLFAKKLEEMIIREIGTSEQLFKALIPDNPVYEIMKTNSRQVLGSMNDFKFQIKYLVTLDGFSNSVHDKIHHSINTIPMGALKYNHPRRAMKSVLEERLN